MNKLLNSEYWHGVLTTASAWVTSFLSPVTPFIAIVFFLVVCDLYTGTRAARKRGDQIHSKGLRRTIEKITLYFIVILLSEGMAYVFKPLGPITYIVAFIIALTEFKSNVENVETVTGVAVWSTIKDKLNINSGSKN